MRVETREEPVKTIAEHNGLDAEYVRAVYKNKLSGFRSWDQLDHAEDYLLYPQNMGPWVSIDEVSLSRGELYTILTNKAGKGRKGSLIAIIKGTKVNDIVAVLLKIPSHLRHQVEEITLDMASSMSSAANACFANAKLVTDRFHVVKLVMEAMHQIRIKLRWEAIEQENKHRKRDKNWRAPQLMNYETPRQMLARLKDVLNKTKSDWTLSQALRARIAFEEYPQLEFAYNHCLELRSIYRETEVKQAKPRFLKWIGQTRVLDKMEFITAAGSVEAHLETILNFFRNRSTNANAESFNAKIKLLRANLRGVEDTKFFLFRLEKLYA
jgi:transposase